MWPPDQSWSLLCSKGGLSRVKKRVAGWNGTWVDGTEESNLEVVFGVGSFLDVFGQAHDRWIRPAEVIVALKI